MLLVVVLVVSGALVVGAAWGIYGKLPTRVEGFLVALAGGALLLSVTSELIEPSIAKSSVFHAMLGVGAGAIVFAVADYLIDEKWGSNSGGGFLGRLGVSGLKGLEQSVGGPFKHGLAVRVHVFAPVSGQ